MWQIFSPGIIIGWTAEQEMRFIFQNAWTEGTVFIHKAVQQKAFVNTEVIYSKPQSNNRVPEHTDRQTGRDTERQKETDRERQRETERDRDTESFIHTHTKERAATIFTNKHTDQSVHSEKPDNLSLYWQVYIPHLLYCEADRTLLLWNWTIGNSLQVCAGLSS